MTNASCSFAKLVLSAVFATGLGGCAAPQRVTYSLDTVPRAEESNIANVKLIVRPLDDDRRNTAGNAVLFNSSNETTIDGESYCINAEERYRPNTVANQISEMLALHLRRRGALRAVSVGDPVAGAYYLSGTLNRYYLAQKSTSVSTATMVMFGAVGTAIAAAGTPDTTSGMISIEIVDLALYDSSGNAIAKLPDIKYTKQLELPAASDCVVVYDNVNEHLKQVFDKYAHAVEEAITNAVYARQPQQAANTNPVPNPAATTNAQQPKQPPAEPW